jgi:hypothetical protein
MVASAVFATSPPVPPDPLREREINSILTLSVTIILKQLAFIPCSHIRYASIFCTPENWP